MVNTKKQKSAGVRAAANSRKNADTNSVKPGKKKWGRRVIWALVILLLIWFAGDFAYSRYVAYQIAQWEKNIVRDDNGIQQGCQDFSIGNGPVAILLVHGFNDSPQVWRKIAPSLAEKNFTCRGIRLPGFGEPVDRYRQSTIEAWLDKVDSEIKALQQSHSMIIVVAHSLGGAVVINHLLKNPNCVDGLVLLAPAVQVSDDRSPLFSAEFWHQFSSWTLPFSQVAMSPFEYDARDPAERDMLGRNKFSPRRVVENTYQLINENRERADEISLPTRVFFSPTDAIVDPSATESFFETLGARHKKLIKAEQAGHAIPVDYGWEQVVDEVEEFANQLSSGAFDAADSKQ
jgi:esterase/lipase